MRIPARRASRRPVHVGRDKRRHRLRLSTEQLHSDRRLHRPRGRRMRDVPALWTAAEVDFEAAAASERMAARIRRDHPATAGDRSMILLPALLLVANVSAPPPATLCIADAPCVEIDAAAPLPASGGAFIRRSADGHAARIGVLPATGETRRVEFIVP